MRYNEVDWPLIKNRFAAFWENELYDAPLISYISPDRDYSHTRYDCTSDASYEELFACMNDPVRMYRHAAGKMEHTQYYGDAFPLIATEFGVAAHAAYFGCPYSLRSDSVWFDPMDFDPDSDSLVFDKQHPALLAQERFIEYAAAHSEHAVVAMPDNCGSVDALAHIRSNDELLADTVIRPEFVKKATMQLVDSLIYSSDIYFDHIRKGKIGGNCISWMQLWSLKKIGQLQCDFSVMISPQMFADYVMPEFEATAAYLEHSVYHLDGQEQVRFLDMLLSMKDLDAIQWTPVVGQPRTTHFIEVLKKIQKAGKRLILFPFMEEVPIIMDHLDPEGVRINLYGSPSPEEFNLLTEKAKSWKRH